jgi:hypothetical protein
MNFSKESSLSFRNIKRLTGQPLATNDKSLVMISDYADFEKSRNGINNPYDEKNNYGQAGSLPNINDSNTS